MITLQFFHSRRFNLRSGNCSLRQRKHICKLAIVAAIILGCVGALRPAYCKEADQSRLVVCALPAAMPRTGRSAKKLPEGIDLVMAEKVASLLGRKLSVRWCKNASCTWKSLRSGKCDVVVGQPHGSGPSRGVAWSVPFAGGQFGLVVHEDKDGIQSLADLRGKRVGIVAGTVAPSEKDHSVVRFKSRKGLLEQFGSKKLDAAFMDADFADWHLGHNPALPLQRLVNYVPREHWNMAMAVRGNDTELLVAINRALSQMAESQQVEKIYAEHGVSYRLPFTGSGRRTARADTWKKIKERGEIVVSMDPANLPYSSADEELTGFDVQLAGALARGLGLKLRIDWIDVQRETAIGELLDNECDLAFGAAIDVDAVDDEEVLEGKVIYSRPYYRTGYVLLQRKDSPRIHSLSDLQGDKSRRLGTEAGSVADYRLRQRGFLRRLFRNQLSALKALQDGHIDYAYLWSNVGWILHKTPEFDLEVVPVESLEDEWNIAIAMRSVDEELKRRVDVVVKDLVNQGVVKSALAEYHVPYRSVSSAVSVRSPQTSQHPSGERGPEPQMYRRQGSRKRYAGLDRIRLSGELVVGLDQNNPPFSEAHPKPEGLDFEIARLLAEQLDLSLRVYWAYSSHDSYPSKLATKESCDVILGVMPDDRFGKRVIYSKPYYTAGYMLVVPANRDESMALDQLGDRPLAVEAGVAVRGLAGQNVREFPSLKEVLEAVADGEVYAGYVVSTSGPWLAEQLWPNRLKFVRIDKSVDDFPICVALRKTDGGLKTAVDSALAELTRSGQLAEVLKRWSIADICER